MLARDWNISFFWRPGTDLASTITENVLALGTVENVTTYVYSLVTWGVLDCLSCNQLFWGYF